MPAYLASAQTLLPAHLASAQTSLPAHLASAQTSLPAHLASAQVLSPHPYPFRILSLPALYAFYNLCSNALAPYSCGT
ncbi:hypothetical protein L1987_74363 [Smallanthus sonchifolius]|uniref:Uncharacterized protein n=1 Tax=Smallanthus sonchifolius TaxID=185202 RepID=A0ACB9A415_9ASTR|nr:hypothetical protein L1987_74363 [Smallanthus sonchifolius]